MIKPLSTLFGYKFRWFLKPILFMFDAEAVHHTFVSLGKTLGHFAPAKWVFKTIFAPSQLRPVTIDGISFPTRVGLAAGFDYNADLTHITPALGFGFHTIGTVTFNPYQGNPTPRLGRFPKSKALLVNKGLKNIGTPAIIKKLMSSRLGQFEIPTGISIASTNCRYDSTHQQLLDIAASFIACEQSALQHAYYEMNISCPNTFGGEPFTTPARLDTLLTALDSLHLTKPLYLKMPIDLSDAEATALLKTASSHQVNGVIFGNLTKDKSNPDVEATDAKEWQHRKGNLSGKPTWNRSNRLIALTKKRFKNRFTIIGLGGIFSPDDAAYKIELGADLVQMITGMVFQGPQVVGQIAERLATPKKVS